MGTWVEETNRLILVKVAQATFLNEILDSRSVTEIRFLYGIEIFYTMESLILAHDER